MAEIGNVTVKVDAVITDEQYREAMGAVRAANERMDLLEAENAKLRVERDEWHRVAASKQDIIDHMRNANSENAKLRKLFNETLIRLVAANEAAGGGFVDARYCELLESHGIEVGE